MTIQPCSPPLLPGQPVQTGTPESGSKPMQIDNTCLTSADPVTVYTTVLVDITLPTAQYDPWRVMYTVLM